MKESSLFSDLKVALLRCRGRGWAVLRWGSEVLSRAGRQMHVFFARDVFIPEAQQSFLLLGDVVVILFSLLFSAFLFEPDFGSYSSGFLLKNMLVMTFITFAVFLALDLYGHNKSEKKIFQWLHPTEAPRSLAIPLIISNGAALPFLRLLGQMEHFSPHTLVLNVLTEFFGMAGLRLGFDAWNERLNQRRLRKAERSSRRVEVLLVGTLPDLSAFLESSQREDYAHLHFLAAVTTNALDCGRYVADVPILGIVDDLPQMLSPQDLIRPYPYIFVVGQSLSNKTLQKISQAAQDAHIPVLTLLRPRSPRVKNLDEISQK